MGLSLRHYKGSIEEKIAVFVRINDPCTCTYLVEGCGIPVADTKFLGLDLVGLFEFTL